LDTEEQPVQEVT